MRKIWDEAPVGLLGGFMTQPRSGTMVFSFLKDSFNKILSINIPIFQYKTLGKPGDVGNFFGR